MKCSSQKQTAYQGFEQGPIRPPSEAESLLIRITRNCPWNHCTFCPVYKGAKFSVRPADHVKQDIDAVARHVAAIVRMRDGAGMVPRDNLHDYRAALAPADHPAFHAALNWHACGMRSIFLQDGNSLIIPPKDLVDILNHLKNRFPMVERITSYARAHTIARISDNDMAAFAAAGLNRIHIGMESGADAVLKRVRKGTDKAAHIKAGRKVKNAGIELSEYVMPGLGGKDLSEIHARETADALNRINPDFIRLRTLAIPGHVPLYEEYASGKFEKLTDEMTAKEILLFLESLDGITSTVKSDHILNLFQDIEGKLPEGKPRMTGIIKRFLALDPVDRVRYQVGRRIGLFSRLEDLNDPGLAAKADEVCRRYGITPDNADDMISELMKQFI
jgi:radical SAM superfamily enzyme YgiQ (UPF0313 family)